MGTMWLWNAVTVVNTCWLCRKHMPRNPNCNHMTMEKLWRSYVQGLVVSHFFQCCNWMVTKQKFVSWDYLYSSHVTLSFLRSWEWIAGGRNSKVLDELHAMMHFSYSHWQFPIILLKLLCIVYVSVFPIHYCGLKEASFSYLLLNSKEEQSLWRSKIH